MQKIDISNVSENDLHRKITLVQINHNNIFRRKTLKIELVQLNLNKFHKCKLYCCKNASANDINKLVQKKLYINWKCK